MNEHTWLKFLMIPGKNPMLRSDKSILSDFVYVLGVSRGKEKAALSGGREGGMAWHGMGWTAFHEVFSLCHSDQKHLCPSVQWTLLWP